MTVPWIPESAPFSSQQRAWLNGFFAGVFGEVSAVDASSVVSRAIADRSLSSLSSPSSASAPALEEEEETFPWHDPSLPLDERLARADGQPIARRLMASMAQLNCGACGYVCKTYSEAIASGEEKDLTRCSPGGTDTLRMLKKLMQEHRESANTNGHAATTTEASKGSSTASHANGTSFASNGKTVASIPGTSRNQPLTAKLIESRRLTHDDAPKDVRHVVIDLGDSALTYEAGDSLGVLPLNCTALVDAILQTYPLSGEEPIQLASGTTVTVREALTDHYALNKCRNQTLELFAESATDAQERLDLRALLDADAPDDFLQTADLLEVLQRFRSARPSVQSFVESLGPLQPRLYSISSSQRAHPREVHLTVGIVRFEVSGRVRNGVASSYLGVRSQPGDALRIYVQRSRFRLPTNPETPVIMVGPGTGIAPFRAFLEEREATRAPGRNWLFFGNQYFHYDFLYREELDRWAESGLLTKLDVAFSRDASTKVYVQDRMREHGAELWQWLEQGAHFYVCGDAKRMAVDVDQTLRDLVSEYGHRTAEEAKQYVADLAKTKRYQKDVY